MPETRANERQLPLWRFEWRWLEGCEAAADEALMQQCADLFSNHYGNWGPRGTNPGASIRIPASHVKGLVDSDEAWLACAYRDETLVGYCASLRFDVAGKGRVAWVTQLVVHEAYRDSRVATNLLYSMWQFSDYYAWGLATVNPLAVRALETATRRPCRAKEITSLGRDLLGEIADHVSYVPTKLKTGERGRLAPKVDTGFAIDHALIPEMQERAARQDRPWDLGGLEEGEEWLACTFQDQPPQGFSDQQITELLTGADGIWIQAYEGMTLDEDHAWRKFAPAEVEFITDAVALDEKARVLDVGCGDGRHARLFAEAGHAVVGVDISERLIARAREERGATGVELLACDAREELPEGPFDLVVCLYDVLGSSARPADDKMLLANMANSLRPGGALVVSALNTDAVLSRLAEDHRVESLEELVAALEQLSPSSTMEQTGAIFDPELMLHYGGNYYRKEQFERASWRLPAELVVRDRRFSVDELTEMLNEAGLSVEEMRPVRAGAWDREPPLGNNDEHARELLAVARKPAR